MNPGLMLFIILIILAFLGLPIYLAIGIATMAAMIQAGFPIEAIPQKTFLGINSTSLLAIPLFILAGNIMAQGVTQRLISISDIVLGRVRGSLACVTILASAIFGAISGSAVATVAAIGGMTVPIMEDQGYDNNYAVGCASSASLLGPMIPPSISLIVYASLTEISIQKLFLATLTPAIVCTILFLIYTLYYGQKHKLPKQKKMSGAQKAKILKDGIWAMIMPVLVLGLIFRGACTVTEAAAIAVIYSAIIALFVYKTITFKNLLDTIYDTSISSAAILILVGMSKASSYIVIASQLPTYFMNLLSSVFSSKFIILLIINIIFIILGCLMEGNSILVMMVPLMLSLVKAFNIDLIQFGIIACLNVYIGCITPPVGMSLLVGAKLGSKKTTMGGAFKACLPFFGLSLIVLALVTYVPQFTIWLPNMVR